MTKREIQNRINKSAGLLKKGAGLESLLCLYYLNSDLLRFITNSLLAEKFKQDVKPKKIITLLLRETTRRGDLKKILSKKELKTTKLWLVKMDSVIKDLKTTLPLQIPALLRDAKNCTVTLRSCCEFITDNKQVK